MSLARLEKYRPRRRRKPNQIAERMALLLWMVEKMRSAPGLHIDTYFERTGRAMRSFRRDIATIEAAGYTYWYDRKCGVYRLYGFDCARIDDLAA